MKSIFENTRGGNVFIGALRMNQLWIGKVIGYVVATALLLIGCHSDNGANPTIPAFGDLSKLGDNKTYVAYPFPDPWKKKLDTLTLSFECNPVKVKTISVKATIDSGKTWLPITTVSPPLSNNQSIHWIPKNPSALPKYFGIKRCFIRIADTTTNEFIDSDTFSLIGAVPMVLLKSLDNDTFHVTDTIKVQYGTNMDLASNIETYFKTDTMTDWIRFFNDSKLPSPDAPPIQNKQNCLIPAAVNDTVKIEAGNFTKPIKIFLKDYTPGAAGASILTGYITILP
jgi:hypothetical protein